MKSLNAIVEQILTEAANTPYIITPGSIEYVFDKKISGKMKKELKGSIWTFIENQKAIDVEKVTYGKDSVIIEPMFDGNNIPNKKQIATFGRGLNEFYPAWAIKSTKELPGSIKMFLGNLKIKRGLFSGNKIPEELYHFMTQQFEFPLDYATYDKKNNAIDIMPLWNMSKIPKKDMDSFVNSIERYLTPNLLSKYDPP